jgi:hypothetical protein
VLKDLNEPDENPYDVTALYTGPGTYQLRLTEACGIGSAEITGAKMVVPDALTGDTTETITVNPVVETTYAVTVTDNIGCEGRTVGELVLVDPGIGPTAVITPSGPTTFCEGGSVDLVASSATGLPPFTYLWSTVPPGLPGDGATTQTIAATEQGDYTVTITDANPCTSVSAPETVTVNALPAPTIDETCGNPSSTLDAGAGYAAYLWNTTPPGGPKDGAKSQTISVPCGTVETYTVMVQDGNGCLGTSPPVNTCPCGGPQPDIYLMADDPTGNDWMVTHDPATTQYYVYYNPLTSFGQPFADDVYDNGATVASDCIAGWADNFDGTATVTPTVGLDNSWLIITAATGAPGSESTPGYDSAGTERSTVGNWVPMCGP